jgi:hypothetical protein
MVATVIEYIALTLTIFCVVLVWRFWEATKARAVLFLGFGFVWWCSLKIGLVLRVEFIRTYSGALSAGIGALMALGLWLFLRDIKKYYNGNGESIHNSIDRQEEAALVVRLAAEAAAKTLEATALAVAETLKAQQSAEDTRTLTIELEGHIKTMQNGGGV